MSGKEDDVEIFRLYQCEGEIKKIRVLKLRNVVLVKLERPGCLVGHVTCSFPSIKSHEE